MFRLPWSTRLGELNVRVNFGRPPHSLTEEEYRQLEEDVIEIITSVQLHFLGESVDAHTIHAVRMAIGNALSEKYADYHPRVAIG